MMMGSNVADVSFYVAAHLQGDGKECQSEREVADWLFVINDGKGEKNERKGVWGGRVDALFNKIDVGMICRAKDRRRCTTPVMKALQVLLFTCAKSSLGSAR